jgi:hypothetical protein
MDSQRAPAKEDVDATLSRRAEFFRSRLIEEFKLLDCLSDQGRQKAPVYSSSNLVEGTSCVNMEPAKLYCPVHICLEEFMV